MTATLEKLPIELREIVFKHLADDSDDDVEYEYNIAECLVVCKSWNRLFQNFLYSDIVLYDYSQVPRLANTLEKNRNLRALVTKIAFKFYIGPKGKRKVLSCEKLFSHLPNLENISFRNDWTFYTPLLSKALMKNQLPYFNHIASPTDYREKKHYESCVNLLKNRSRNLTISEALEDYDYNFKSTDEEDENDTRSIHFQHLFDALDHFKNITELHISKKTNNIVDLMEKAARDCPSLEQLHISTITSRSKKLSDSNVHYTITSDPHPTINVRYLKFSGGIVLYNSHVLQYIMSTFPRLDSLIVSGINRRIDLDQHTFNQFLKYLIEIKTVKIKDIPYHDEQAFVDSVGTFWERLSQSDKVSVQFSSLDLNVSDYKGTMNVDIKDGQCKIYIADIARICLKYKALFEKFGEYIDELAFSRINSDVPNEEIFNHPLRHCSELKKYTLSESTLRASNFSNSDLSER